MELKRRQSDSKSSQVMKADQHSFNYVGTPDVPPNMTLKEYKRQQAKKKARPIAYKLFKRGLL